MRREILHRKNAQRTACQRNVKDKQSEQEDSARCSVSLKILTHDKMTTGSAGSWVTQASAVAIWVTANWKREHRRAHTVERLGTENSICLGFRLHWSISTPTSTRVIADTSAFLHCIKRRMVRARFTAVPIH